MALLEQWKGGFRYDGPPSEGHVMVASIGSQPVVVQTDTETITCDTGETAVNDVYACLGADATNAPGHIYCRIITVPKEYSYLDLTHHYYLSAAGDSLTSGPKVLVYGRCPYHYKSRPRRWWPQDINSDFPDLMAIAGDTDVDGMWVPLTEPNYTVGNPEIDFDIGDSINYEIASGETYHVSESKFVFLSGCDKLLVMIHTAAVFVDASGGGTPAGMMVGRFVA